MHSRRVSTWRFVWSHIYRPKYGSNAYWDINAFRKRAVKCIWGNANIIPKMKDVAPIYYMYCYNGCVPARAYKLMYPKLGRADDDFHNHDYNNDPNKQDDVHRLRLASEALSHLIFWAEDKEDEIKEFAIKYWGRRRLNDYKINVFNRDNSLVETNSAAFLPD